MLMSFDVIDVSMFVVVVEPREFTAVQLQEGRNAVLSRVTLNLRILGWFYVDRICCR